MVKYLEYINVVYTGSAPPNALKEEHGGNADINKGMGGSFVWLEPVWNSDPFECATSIEVKIQPRANDGFQDMAKGAGGTYRYLVIINDQNVSYRITKVGLWKTSDANDLPSKDGWTDWTDNINEGRGGDYIYICWETNEDQAQGASRRKMPKCLEFINVVDTDTAPANAIKDVNGGSGDINKGQGGKFVWLEPVKIQSRLNVRHPLMLNSNYGKMMNGKTWPRVLLVVVSAIWS